MTKAEIIAIIKSKLDELTPFNEGLVVSVGSENIAPITNHIDSVLTECIEDIVKVSPIHLLPLTDFVKMGLSITDSVGTIAMPADYLRLGVVRFPCWERSVTMAFIEGSPQALGQANKYTRGGFAKPVIVLVSETAGNKFKIYTITQPANGIDYPFTYVKRLSITEIPDLLIAPFTWLATSKVFSIMDMAAQAQLADAQFKNSLMIR